MPSLTAHILRIETLVNAPNRRARLLSTPSNTPEYFIQAQTLLWQTRFAEAGGASHDLSGYVSVTLVVSAGVAAKGVPLMVKTVEADDFGECDEEEWGDGTGQQATFAFTAAEIGNLAAPQEGRWLFWRITAVVDDDDNTEVELGRGYVQVIGNGATGVPAATAALYATLAQLTAVTARVTLLEQGGGGGGTSISVPAGGQPGFATFTADGHDWRFPVAPTS